MGIRLICFRYLQLTQIIHAVFEQFTIILVYSRNSVIFKQLLTMGREPEAYRFLAMNEFELE